jgi:hypothetical protein
MVARRKQEARGAPAQPVGTNNNRPASSGSKVARLNARADPGKESKRKENTCLGVTMLDLSSQF